MTGLFLKNPPQKAAMMNASEIVPASPIDEEFEQELTTLLTTLDIPKDAARTPGTALLFAHQLPTWVSV